MSDQASARSKTSPALPAPDEYDAICAVLMHTERGRWFLQEYASRSRSADTQLLLSAIRRIECVMRAERSAQVRQGFRSDLLEMARAITRTRAEVAEIRPPAISGPAPSACEPAQSGDIFATAERIRDVAWAMRGQGFDPSTCHQLEELAGSILSASSLRDPADHRAHKLSEALHYLEHRIETMLEGCKESPAAPDLDPDPFAPAAVPGPRWSKWPPAEAETAAPASEVLRFGPKPSISLLAGPPTEAGGEIAEADAPSQLTAEPAAAEAPATAGALPQAPASDPLAPLRAMSEVERIALFS
jgi:hypothetical protein